MVIQLKLKQIGSLFIVYLILVAILHTVLVVLDYTNLDTTKQLITHGIQTTGDISEFNCEYDDSFAYHFKANGRDYTSRGFSSEYCNHLYIGKEVNVYYVPSDPALTTTETPLACLIHES